MRTGALLLGGGPLHHLMFKGGSLKGRRPKAAEIALCTRGLFVRIRGASSAAYGGCCAEGIQCDDPEAEATLAHKGATPIWGRILV